MVLFAMTGVFAYSEEIIKGNGAHVANGGYLVGSRFCTKFDEVFDQTDGDGELVLCRWVLLSVSLNLAFELEPIFALATVGRIGPSVHFEHLADGT